MTGYLLTALFVTAALLLGRQAQITSGRINAYHAYIARKRAQIDRIPEDVCWMILRGVTADYARDVHIARLRGDLPQSRHLTVVGGS